MTRHVPRHANCVTRKSNHSLNSNRIRNPWTSDQQCAEHVSSSNSLQARLPAYCTLSGPGPPSHLMGGVAERRSPCYPMQPPYVTMPRMKSARMYASYVERASPVRINPAVSHKTPRSPHRLYAEPGSVLNSGCSTSRTSSDRPVSPLSLSVADGIIDPCGGYCRTFERCCHYMLQVIFIMGILVGVSLVMAAYYLHNQRKGGDQLVLVYIGVLMALVCTLLLSIQCGVEREVRRKKHNRRANAALLARHRSHMEVPLRDLGNGGGSRFPYNVKARQDVPAANAYCQVPLLYHPYQFESQSRSCDEMSQSQNGIPWWRRHELEVTSNDDNII